MFADDSIPLCVNPDCIFTHCNTFGVYWPIASEGSLMLHYPNSLYTGIDPEMEKYWGFPHLHGSSGNRWAWPGCLVSFSLCQQRQRSWLIAMGGEQRFQWTTIVTCCCKGASMKISVLTARGGADHMLMEGGRKMFWIVLPFLACLREKAAMRSLLYKATLVGQASPSALLFTFSCGCSKVFGCLDLNVFKTESCAPFLWKGAEKCSYIFY